MKKPTTDDKAAWEKYNAYLANKALKNREYRARRSAREKQMLNLVANDSYPIRERWLAAASKLIEKKVAELGFTPTNPIRVSLGVVDTRSRKAGKTLATCYCSEASEGGYREIFVSPEMVETRMVLGALTHEIGHACLPPTAGHRAPFRKFCTAVGFKFEKAEHAHDGEAWWEWAQQIVKNLGQIPHKKLNVERPVGAPKKQGTRLLKLECPCCGAKLRLARSTLEAIYENSGSTIAQCIDPACSNDIDFSELLDS